jgi:hypothetical protein
MPVAWDLPPMTGLQDMFSDMANNALALGLADALEIFKGRSIKIATMCSGTEAPILALGMISEGMFFPIKAYGHSCPWLHRMTC